MGKAFDESDPFRFEFKYQLDRSDALAVEHDLKRLGMILDPNARSAPTGDYPVTSLYFDSPILSDFYDKLGGFLDRKKIRARIYSDYLDDRTDNVWLEIKKKHNACILKHRVKLSKGQWQKFLNRGGMNLPEGQFSEAETGTLKEIVWHVQRDLARPLVFVRYRRRPYILRNHTMRVTFDSFLETCPSGDLSRPASPVPVEKGAVIMELKFDSTLPSWFNFLVRKYGLVRDEFSKYARSAQVVNRYDPLPR